jgi:hypothetical protein
MTNKNEYTAVVILSSTGDSNDVNVSIEWNPNLTGKDIEEAGFIPASFLFVQDFIMPALEQAFQESEYAEIEGSRNYN